MFGTYKTEDVELLLKDITGLVEPLETQEREKRIQSGMHYFEMLPIEYKPSPKYLAAYYDAVERYAGMTADAVGHVAEQIWHEKGENTVLVSLARAGTPVGILIKRYLAEKYHKDVKHYTISIIRGGGIDHNAMRYILERHQPSEIQFVDGWVGKGAIQRELKEAMHAYDGVSPGLAVLSDPARIAEKSGTHDDFLIASSCLNSTVSGLLSRTFYRSDIIEETDFHGAVFYEELLEDDLTYQFIDAVAEKFSFDSRQTCVCDDEEQIPVTVELDEIQKTFQIADINLIKPGIGEATRVLLRRMPWKILVKRLDDEEHLGHLYQLAKEKGVPLVEYPLKNYRACGLIRSMADT